MTIPIISFICNEVNISEEDFFSEKRNEKFVIARIICSSILFNMKYKHSYIASYIKRDRTTIYYYEKLHKALMYSDKLYRENYEKIIDKLNQVMS